ncbi:anti-sigma factor family protein [Cohnella sp. GCM10012308]|uniref:anti-sigma factor family protein n=1 Tax=Cohnella sp. GCM10012308 TaxID=3317329 RepID=UPI0036183BB0
MSDHPAEWLSAYMDEELDESQRQEIDLHLAACASCSAILSDLMDMQKQMTDFYLQIEAPAALERNVMEALDRASPTSAAAKSGAVLIPAMMLLVFAAVIYKYGDIWLKVFAVLLKFTVTAAYIVSHVASSIPTVWITATIVAECLMLLSGLSLKRILRSSAQSRWPSD